jgi:hypothetical protein
VTSWPAYAATREGRSGAVTLLAVGILKDIGGRAGGKGPVEPEVQLGDADGRCDLGALLLGRPESAGVHDLEDVLGLGVLLPAVTFCDRRVVTSLARYKKENKRRGSGTRSQADWSTPLRVTAMRYLRWRSGARYATGPAGGTCFIMS